MYGRSKPMSCIHVWSIETHVLRIVWQHVRCEYVYIVEYRVWTTFVYTFIQIKEYIERVWTRQQLSMNASSHPMKLIKNVLVLSSFCHVPACHYYRNVISRDAPFFSRGGCKCTPLLQQELGTVAFRPTLEMHLQGWVTAPPGPGN